jgi:signal transduction histidine kinase/DNA-binding response OmpR family regulator
MSEVSPIDVDYEAGARLAFTPGSTDETEAVGRREAVWQEAESLATVLRARGAVMMRLEPDGRLLRALACVLNGRRESEFALEVPETPFAALLTGTTNWHECSGRDAERLSSETLFPGNAARIVSGPVHDAREQRIGIVCVLDPDVAFSADALATVVDEHARRMAIALGEAPAARDTGAPPAPTERERALEHQVSALQTMNRELSMLRDSLEAGNQAKSEFLGSVGQDLRTPLNGVLGMLNLLLETPLDSEQRELGVQALASCEAMLSTVDDILDFTSLESGQVLIEPLPFDLRSAAEEVVDRYSAAAAHKGIELVLQYSPDSPTRLVGDPARVRQIISSLVENAVKFTQHGHVLVTMDTPVVSSADTLVRLTVEDTGTGMVPDRLAHVFLRDPGSSKSRLRRAGDAGVELPLVKKLAELMGGTVLATSRPGVGSTFTLTLRLALDRSSAQPAPAAPPTSPLSDVRALVVDDVEIHRLVLRRQMGSLGMRVDVAPDADSALLMLREAATTADPFRLALIDNVMPGMSGEQLGRELRADARTAGLALMMFTASGDRGEAKRFAQAGFDGYFVKPILPSMLKEALVTVLGARALAGRSTGRIVTRQAIEDVAHASTTPAVAPVAQGRPRVLLAEDNAINQKVATRLLQKLGYDVDVACDGNEALERWRREPYAIVFMDCQMPGMDGFQATAEIRRLEAGSPRHTPIIALTASVLPSDRERCRVSGMDDFVPKPIREGALQLVIRRTTERLGAAQAPLAA